MKGRLGKVLEVARPFLALNWLVGLFRFIVERFQPCLLWIGEVMVSLVPAAEPVPEIARYIYAFTTGWYEDLFFPVVQGALAWLPGVVPIWLTETLLLGMFTWGAASRAALFQSSLGDRRYFHPFGKRLTDAWTSDERWRSILIEIAGEVLFRLALPAQLIIRQISRPFSKLLVPHGERFCSLGMENTLREVGFPGDHKIMATLRANREAEVPKTLTLVIETGDLTADPITNSYLHHWQRLVMGWMVTVVVVLSVSGFLALIALIALLCHWL